MMIMKKDEDYDDEVAFTAVVLANTSENQTLNNVIDTCISEIQEVHDAAVVWNTYWAVSGRNTLALEATSDNLARAKELKMIH